MAAAPATVTIEAWGGTVTVVASPRDTADVDVAPFNAESSRDADAARNTVVDRGPGRVAVRVPKPGVKKLFGHQPATGIRAEVPEGTNVRVRGWSQIDLAGPLGEVEVDASVERVSVDRCQTLDLKSSVGAVQIGEVAGRADVTSSIGEVQIERLCGPSTVRSSVGQVEIHSAESDLQVKGAHSGVVLHRVTGAAAVASTHGRVRIVRLIAGSVDVSTSHGPVEIGVAEGIPAWLDVQSQRGRILSHLDGSGPAPEADEASVSVRTRTKWGSITLKRA
ncbi:DUF4097 family beta strand repeat-containing protein [Nocardiopsis coralliicola]